MTTDRDDTRRERAKPLAAADRRAAIIAATEPLLIEHGAATTTRLIAEAAGVAEGTIFRHFASLRELYRAVAEQAFAPRDEAETLAAMLAELPDLESKLRATIDQLTQRMQRGVLIMMSVRTALAAAEPDGTVPGTFEGAHKHGPPTFLIEANKRLIDNLTTLLFEPHADELRLPPRKAALVLRSLTIGAWLPGLPRTNQPLSSDDVIDVLLGGILTRERS